MRLGRPANKHDLGAFLTFTSDPIANDVCMPYQKRPQYFKSFLQLNSIELIALNKHEEKIKTYGQVTGHDIKLADCVLDLHHVIDFENLGQREAKLRFRAANE